MFGKRKARVSAARPVARINADVMASLMGKLLVDDRRIYPGTNFDQFFAVIGGVRAPEVVPGYDLPTRADLNLPYHWTGAIAKPILDNQPNHRRMTASEGLVEIDRVIDAKGKLDEDTPIGKILSAGKVLVFVLDENEGGLLGEPGRVVYVRLGGGGLCLGLDSAGNDWSDWDDYVFPSVPVRK